MRNELDVLIDKIEDSVLRGNLRSQVRRLRAKRTFGLVFESHLPERVRLPEHPVRVGVKVCYRKDPNSPIFEVLAVQHNTVTLQKVQNPDGSSLSTKEVAELKNEKAELNSLVVIADFGEPLFPGLRHLGSIERGGDKPDQIVVKGENHHVLEALQFTHAGKVDCVYIDPPYNSGARDWKYNNNYVDESDAYRHSKWLAFMERRLLLAKQLLNPEDSILIVTIDEKECMRLGLLLEQVFVGCRIQMVTTVINPKGASLGRDFARVDEHIFFVFIGDIGVRAEVRDMLDEKKNSAADRTVKWSSLIRGGAQGIRTDSPGAYYPVFIDAKANTIHSFGEALPWGADEAAVVAPVGCTAVWPPRHPSGVEGRWGIGPDKASELLQAGALRLGKVDIAAKKFPMSYLSSGIMEKVLSGEIITVGRRADNTLIVRYPEDAKVTQPKTVWNMKSHNAGEYGSKLVSTLLPGRKFPFPKSLYAVEDALQFFLLAKPEAVVLDFFGGSGTTTHAIARLNRRDGGRRQCILITNNEVSADEAAALRKKGFTPGDSAWESVGIFEHITRPRIETAITGLTPDGNPINGDYKFIDEFPMAEGFDENVKFFELTYLDPEVIELDIAFNGIAPLLWLRAGGRGSIISEGLDAESQRKPYVWTDKYGVLFNPDRWRSFVRKRPDSASAAFIITDSQTTFAGIASELPGSLDVVRLYENYLTTFEINGGHV